MFSDGDSETDGRGDRLNLLRDGQCQVKQASTRLGVKFCSPSRKCVSN
jgi:hypothetical protein